MKIYKSGHKLKNTVITIGSFDGVHIGHQCLIKTAQAEARNLGIECGVVSFDPIPIQFFHSKFPFLLTVRREKEDILDKLGVDFIYYLSFDKQLAKIKPKDFLNMIEDHFKPSIIITGRNHRFGKDRKGDIKQLKKYFEKLERKVINFDPITIDGSSCSSTNIREALVTGRVTAAWRLLGRPYQMSGIIKRGTGKGKKIGFPTINLAQVDKNKLLPTDGVYLIKCHIKGRILYGAMSIGEVTSIKQEHTIEAHLFEYSEDSYGADATIEILYRIRDLKHFTSSEDLKGEIKKDIELAKRILENI